MTEDYAAKYRNNILVKEKGELPEEDQLHTENIQDFKLVENRIDEIIKGAKDNITILFCNIHTLKREETQNGPKIFEEKNKVKYFSKNSFSIGCR